MLEKNFIRVWLGNNSVPELFELWWNQFKEMHPDFNFITINDQDAITLLDENDICSNEIRKIYYSICKSYSARSDVIRILALKKHGGIYLDTDMMPLKPFYPLIKERVSFAGKRSSKSFEAAVLGTYSNSDAIRFLIEKLPEYVEEHKESTIPSGPGFISKFWFNRDDVLKLPMNYFYPYNGFGAPKRDEKIKIFDKKDFPAEMYAAHLSNRMWGGKPKDFKKN